MFSQLTFFDPSYYVGEHISQNDDTALQEEADSDLKPFIHISFEEKIPVKESRSENILQRDEFHARISSLYLSLYIDLFDNNGFQSYILDSNDALLSLKEVQIDYEMHDQQYSYPCHQTISSCHSSLLEMNTISNDYFQNFSFYDPSFNKEIFPSYNQLLDGEYSYENVNDTSSTFINSHIFSSPQVNTQRQFDLYENIQINQPIYDNFYDNKLEQIGCDFADLIQENVPKEIIVQEEALDSYNIDFDSISNNLFHCMNLSNPLCHYFDFHCTYHDWVAN